ncbi:MAG: hypothetical protein KJO70_09650, partial [Gammaproteobacteria bacterium]|nr:hypothetical protein [Gammaproteobacteria bacterium]
CTMLNTLQVVSRGIIAETNFESGTTEGWSGGSNIGIDGTFAIDQYSIRVGKRAASELAFSTAGYRNVSVTMWMATTSLLRTDACYAEISTNGGFSWTGVLTMTAQDIEGSFQSNTLSLPSADDNLNVRLRYRNESKGKGGFCYGDEVVVEGTLL